MCTSPVPYAISTSGFFLLLWSLLSNNPFPYSPLSSRFFTLHNNYLTVLDMDTLACSSTDGTSWSAVSRVTKPPKLGDSFSSNAYFFYFSYYLVSSNGTLWTGSTCTSWTSRTGMPWGTKPRHGATLQHINDDSSSWLVYGGGYNPVTYACHYDSYSTGDGVNWYKFTVPDLGPGCRFRTTVDFNYQYYLLTTDTVYTFQGSGDSFYFEYENDINGPVYAQTIVWEEWTTNQGENILGQGFNTSTTAVSFITSSAFSSSKDTRSLSTLARIAIQSLQRKNLSLHTKTEIIDPGTTVSPPVIRNTVYVWMSFYAIDDPSNPQPPHNRYSFSHDMSMWMDEGQQAPYEPAYNGLVFVNSFPSSGANYFLVGGYTLAGQQGMDPNVWSGSAVYYDPSDTVATVTARPSTSTSRTPSTTPTPSASASPSNSPSSSPSHSNSPTSSSSRTSTPSHSSSRTSTPTAYPSSCPVGHYGFHCQVCPGYNPSAGVCNGHGDCNGEGTAIGNGNCICFTGWTGPTCADSSEMSTSTKIAIGGGIGGGITVVLLLVGIWCRPTKGFYRFARPTKKSKGTGLLDEEEENYDDDHDGGSDNAWNNSYDDVPKKTYKPPRSNPSPSAPWMEFGTRNNNINQDPTPLSTNYVPPSSTISRTPTIDPVDTHEITTLIIGTLNTINLLSHVEEILPALYELCTRLDGISPKVVGDRWLARDKIHSWETKLRDRPAHETLSTEEKTQLCSDVELMHHEYGRLLRNYYRK